MAVELATTKFQACQEANSHFCSITTPFQPLANPPSCIAALHAKSFLPLANPPSCIAALHAKSTVDITSKCSLQM